MNLCIEINYPLLENGEAVTPVPPHYVQQLPFP